jgi:hypothetical protein
LVVPFHQCLRRSTPRTIVEHAFDDAGSMKAGVDLRPGGTEQARWPLGTVVGRMIELRPGACRPGGSLNRSRACDCGSWWRIASTRSTTTTPRCGAFTVGVGRDEAGSPRGPAPWFGAVSRRHATGQLITERTRRGRRTG